MASPGYDTFCRYCGKPIIFIRTENGKLMPCDATPVAYWKTNERGIPVYQLSGYSVKAVLSGHPSAISGYGYRPHWISCTGYPKKKTSPEREVTPARRAIREQLAKERAASAAREKRAREKAKAEAELKEAEGRQYRLGGFNE